MNVRYCSICSTSFDIDVDGVVGSIGMIPFALCYECKTGLHEYFEFHCPTCEHSPCICPDYPTLITDPEGRN